jgi:stress response protein SCP2
LETRYLILEVKVHLVENISQIDSVYGGAVNRRIEYNNSCEEREISALMMIKGTRIRQKNHFLFQNQRKAPRQGVEMWEEEKHRKEGLEQKEQ